MKVKVNANISTAAILKKRGLGRDFSARRHLANTVRRLSDSYVPMQQGTLKNTAQIDADAKSIIYGQPYARYQYHGKLMIGRAPKRLTNIDLDHHGAPMRGPFWDKRMMQARGNEVIDDLARFVGGKRK